MVTKVSSIILLLILCSFQAEAALKFCRRYICSEKSEQPSGQSDDTFCLNEQTTGKDLYKVYVYPDMCSSSQYCSYYSIINDEGSEVIYSVCRSNPTTSLIYSTAESYPGEACDTYGVLYSCSYGRQQCYYNRCAGNELNETCTDSRDCTPNLYCKIDSGDISGICTAYKAAGDTCTANEECGRTRRCMFSSKTATSGICTEYFSIEDGVSLYVRSEYDIFLCKSMIAEDASFVATEVEHTYNNYTFRETTMTCGVKMLSTAKGEECLNYADCPVTINGEKSDNRYAECGCSYGSSLYAKCGIMNGDDEFAAYRTAFVNYFDKTRYCHVSRGFDFDCGAKPEFYKFKCAQSKAMHYFESQAVSCLPAMTNSELFPELYETTYWCNLAESEQV